MIEHKELTRTPEFMKAVVISGLIMLFVGIPCVIGWIWIVRFFLGL